MLTISVVSAQDRLTEKGSIYEVLAAGEAGEAAVYRPSKVDRQSPHSRDEAYVVATGEGDFVHDGGSRRVGPGDLVFVPKGARHRFDNFTEGFTTWVFFFGR